MSQRRIRGRLVVSWGNPPPPLPASTPFFPSLSPSCTPLSPPPPHQSTQPPRCAGPVPNPECGLSISSNQHSPCLEDQPHSFHRGGWKLPPRAMSDLSEFPSREAGHGCDMQRPNMASTSTLPTTMSKPLPLSGSQPTHLAQ